MNKISLFTNQNINIEKIICVIENKTKREFIPFKPHGRCNNGLIYITEGSTLYNFGNRSFTVQKGDILFLPMGSTYSMDILTPDYIYIFVDFSFFGISTDYAEYFRMPESFRCEHDFRAMLISWNHNELCYKTKGKMYLYKIISNIQKFINFEYYPEHKKSLLEPAVEYILKNYTQNITVAELAKISGISEGHFRRIFLSAYKTSPQKFIISKRLQKASELLKFSNRNITDISTLSGFSSIYYFSRLFKQETGMTPAQYRKYMQAEK